MNKSNKIELTLWLVVFLALISFFGFQYENIIGGAMDNSDFNVVDGKIIKSSTSFSSGGRTGSGYYLDIVYSYSINGENFESDKYSFGSSFFGNLEEAELLSSRYKYGDRVEVYVSDRDPTIAVLSLNEDSNFKLLMTLFILIFVFSIVVFDVRKRWKLQDKKNSTRYKKKSNYK